MNSPIVTYIHLSYEQFKSLEAQCKAFNETTHKTEGGFYHKSLRLDIGGAIWEFHGPLVGGYGHLTPKTGGAREEPTEPFELRTETCSVCNQETTTGVLLPCIAGSVDNLPAAGCPYKGEPK